MYFTDDFEGQLQLLTLQLSQWIQVFVILLLLAKQQVMFASSLILLL